MYLIIGSAAINHYHPNEYRFPANDIDILVDYKRIKKLFGDISNINLISYLNSVLDPKYKHLKIELHSFNDGINKDIYELNGESQFAHPSIILALKKTHIAWDIHWFKTHNDIIFLEKKGYKPNYFGRKNELFLWHVEKHGKKWAKLGNKTEQEFFYDNVQRKYNHDDIHNAVAWFDEPLYSRFLKSENSVACDKTKFYNLTKEEQILAVREEIIVTALERWLIPNDFKFSYNLAYFYAFKKLCTTMSSGWFKEFIIENYIELYKNGDWSPIERFKNNLSLGKVRLCQTNKK